MQLHAIIYTDGACLGKAALRPGGWAAVILIDQVEQVIMGFHPTTTISAMELTAVIRALEAVPPGSRVTLHTDSAAVIQIYRQRRRCGGNYGASALVAVARLAHDKGPQSPRSAALAATRGARRCPTGELGLGEEPYG
jgi:hypothetical protein